MPLTIVRQDIATMQVDCIVNSTNPQLQCDGHGVDWYIHQAAGPELQAALNHLAPCSVGSAVLTDAYRLPCRYVIHAVGPSWHGGLWGEKKLLASCYRTIFALAEEYHIESIAVPVLCSGAYRFPKEAALTIAREEMEAWLQEHDADIYLVVYDKETLAVSRSLFRQVDEFLAENLETEKGTDGARHDYRFQQTMVPDRTQYSERESQIRNVDTSYTRFSRADHFSVEDGSPYDETSAPTVNGARPMPEPAKHTKKSISPKVPAAKAEAVPDAGKLSAPVVAYGSAEIAFDPVNGFHDLDKGFAEMVLWWIDTKHMTDPQCYKSANISKAVFHKLKKSTLPKELPYMPSKSTAIAIAIGLKLNLDQTNDLLMRAGYTLSHAIKGDVIVEYFISKGKYDILLINEVLFDYDQGLLGST